MQCYQIINRYSTFKDCCPVTHTSIIGCNVYGSYEDAYQVLEQCFCKFMHPDMANRTPKIYIDEWGFSVDCYDETDSVQETYTYSIEPRNLIYNP